MNSIRHRDEFGPMLTAMGLIGQAVEVGVHRGEFSKVLLDSWPGTLHVVDPWVPMPEYASDPLNDGDRDADYQETLRVLMPHGGRFVVYRTTSTGAAQEFNDASLDFFYLDANHEEPFVRQDLEIWYPKVRSKGVFAGHDILTHRWPGVARAVEEFRMRHGIPKVNITWETGGSWWWVKP